MGSPYPTGGYRPGSAAYKPAPGLQSAQARLLDQVLRNTLSPELQRLLEAGTLGQTRIPPSAYHPRSAVPDKGQSRWSPKALNRLHPFLRATALAEWLLAQLEAAEKPVLNYPGFTLQNTCGPWPPPYTNNKVFRGQFPAASLGCIGGQYPLDPSRDLGGNYTGEEVALGFAIWCDRTDAPVDPRCATMEIYRPNTTNPPAPGGSPYSPGGSPQTEESPSSQKNPVPWEMLNQRDPWNSPHQVRENDPREQESPLIQPRPPTIEEQLPLLQTQTQPERAPPDPPAKPPGPGKREWKGLTQRMLWRLMGSLTEGFDVLNAAYDALPCKIRAKDKFPGRKRPVSVEEKFNAVWNNINLIDAQRFGFNLVYEGVTDALYAMSGRAGQMGDLSQREGGHRQKQFSEQGDVDLPHGRLPTQETKEALWKLATGSKWPMPPLCGAPRVYRRGVASNSRANPLVLEKPYR